MDYITMSHKEIKRYDIIKKLINQELNGSEAAGLLELSVRHIKRLKVKVKEKGAAGLAHASRSRSGNRKMPKLERQKIVKLISRYYADFKSGFVTEKLAEKHGSYAI